MDDVRTLEFRGRLVPDSFAEFARHRAARLSLRLEVLGQTAADARFRIIGPADLLDAFELALSLGPANSLVHDVRRLNGAGGG